MKIKNKMKFIISTTILVLIVIFTILVSNKSFSNVKYERKIIYISSGDTLWTIAQEEQQYNKYYENKSINEIIYDIKNINNLETGYIYEGEKIEIPYL